MHFGRCRWTPRQEMAGAGSQVNGSNFARHWPTPSTEQLPVRHLSRCSNPAFPGCSLSRPYGSSGATLVCHHDAEQLPPDAAPRRHHGPPLSRWRVPVLLGSNESRNGPCQEGSRAGRGRELRERGAARMPPPSPPRQFAGNDGWRIRGEKCWRWATAAAPEHFIVFALTGEPGARNNISTFWSPVPRRSHGSYEARWASRGTTTTNFRLDVWVLGRHGRKRRAWQKLALSTLNIGRRIVVAAQALGIALCSYRAAAN